MEACWHQNRSKIDANLEERFFEKTLFFLRKNHDFEGSGGSKLEVKNDQKSIKSRVRMGRHLGIGFYWILGGFLEPSWEAKSLKIDPKRHRKNDEKKKVNKMANKTLQEPTRVSVGRSPNPRGGPPHKAG